uniref:Ig-like domain-containing protein n=1 Tax=Podarcis muralis TaxID=64176 RepID=A0A670K1M5_PODMU
AGIHFLILHFHLIFLLPFLVPGCEAQFTMTQPPFVSASMGETVGISCTRSSGGIRSKWNHWYQQKPNSAPILLIYKDEERVSGIPERFSGSYDTSANSVTLTISNVQAEDEAHYYCQAEDSSTHTMIQADEEVRQKPSFRWADEADGLHGVGRNDWQNPRPGRRVGGRRLEKI